MKQTAVEWLFENWKNSCNSLQDMIGLFEQAKELENQQREKDYNEGYEDASNAIEVLRKMNKI